MYKGKTIGVVVPAYNEEKPIGRVIETMPKFVDKMIIVDDCSKDKTVEKVKSYANSVGDKLILVQHKSNQGVGATVVSGYKRAVKEKLDVTVVMAGDAQMDPEELPLIVGPVVAGEADYVKGNRLVHGQAWETIPKYRYIGNSILSLLTKIASGYWHVADSQGGYTAISLEALKVLELDKIYKKYGFPNDMLILLNIHNFRVKDVPIRPVYNVGEQSGIRLYKVIPTISFLLLRRFLWRLKEKYIVRDFHPLVFFYLMAFLLLIPGFIFGAYLLYFRLVVGKVGVPGVILAAFLLISGFQSLFFAMWFDMEYNKDLK